MKFSNIFYLFLMFFPTLYSVFIYSAETASSLNVNMDLREDGSVLVVEKYQFYGRELDKSPKELSFSLLTVNRSETARFSYSDVSILSIAINGKEVDFVSEEQEGINSYFVKNVEQEKLVDVTISYFAPSNFYFDGELYFMEYLVGLGSFNFSEGLQRYRVNVKLPETVKRVFGCDIRTGSQYFENSCIRDDLGVVFLADSNVPSLEPLIISLQLSKNIGFFQGFLYVLSSEKNKKLFVHILAFFILLFLFKYSSHLHAFIFSPFYRWRDADQLPVAYVSKLSKLRFKNDQNIGRNYFATLTSLAIKGYIKFYYVDSNSVKPWWLEFKISRGSSNIYIDDSEKHLLENLSEPFFGRSTLHFSNLESFEDFVTKSIKSAGLFAYNFYMFLFFAMATLLILILYLYPIMNYIGWAALFLTVIIDVAMLMLILGIYFSSEDEAKKKIIGFIFCFILFFLFIPSIFFSDYSFQLISISIFLLLSSSFLFKSLSSKGLAAMNRVKRIEAMIMSKKLKIKSLSKERFEYFLPYSIALNVEEAWLDRFFKSGEGYEFLTDFDLQQCPAWFNDGNDSMANFINFYEKMRLNLAEF